MSIFSRVFKRRQSGDGPPDERAQRPAGRDLGLSGPAGRVPLEDRETDAPDLPGPGEEVEARLSSLFHARRLLEDDAGPRPTDDIVPARVRDDEPPEVATDDVFRMTDEEVESTLELFGSIAALYIRPVQEFVRQLRKGPYTSEGLEMCIPAIDMVLRSAESMGAEELVPRLERFNDDLGEAANQDENSVDGLLRERILASYAELEAVLPEAFAIPESDGPADDVILYSLLRQIPEVGTVTLDKVFSAGLTSVDMFEMATPKDLAVTAGIPEALAQRICVRVHGYIVERRDMNDGDATRERLERLRSLAAEMEAHHDAYEDLRNPDEEPTEARGRRRHRRARQDAALKVNVVLAELGERALVDELLKMPFGERITRLARYLDDIDASGAG